ncbi:MAG: GNAT family N-acetyltransferase [Hyphomicrobiaceae bacterium]
MTIRNLDAAFAPKSVALFGASARPGSIGRTVMENLYAGGFKGEILPVNPRYDHIGNHPCFRSADALPVVPDLAVIATPPATIPGIVTALGERGTRSAVVISAGLTDDNGLRQAMLDAAQPHTFRIIGPNCIGIQVPGIGLDASFAHVEAQPGSLAFLSQSGALVGAVLDWAQDRDIGFSHIVSMGDMADVDVGDMLDYLAGESGTHAILMYLETITNPQKFMSAARAAARIKPVVVVKAGRHRQAAKAAQTHTGALAGSDDVASAAFQRAGLLRVERLEDLFIAAEALTRSGPLDGDRLAILTNGGGSGVLGVDKLIDLNGTLAGLSPETIAALDVHLPANWSQGNPVDIIGDAGRERYQAALDVLLDSDDCDAVLVMACPTALAAPEDAADAVVETIAVRKSERKKSKPVLTNWLGDAGVADARRRLTDAGIPTYETPADAITSFSYLTGYRQAQRALMRTPPARPDDLTFDTERARAVLADVAGEGRRMLRETEAKDVLAAFGIETVPTLTAGTSEEVASHAGTLLKASDAVVVKILSRDITHKSDVGGVQLNIRTVDDARFAASAMLERIWDTHPAAKIDGFTVQPMVVRKDAHELILGMTQDPIFGPVILFGTGGTAVETINDKAVALPPLDLQLAHDLVDKTRISNLLKGYRNRPAIDFDALCTTLIRLSQIVIDCPEIVSLDINPLFADKDGVIALDARVEIDPALCGVSAPNPRLAIRPYPNAWEKTLSLPSGHEMHIRPIRPEDEVLYDTFAKNLSREDVYYRFFTPRREFTHEFIARFTQIDYARAMAFIALDPVANEMLGVVRMSADRNYETAEFAVIVRHDKQRQGIGRSLMAHLIDYARAEGLEKLTGHVLSQNTRMLGLCRSMGFEQLHDREDPTMVRVFLPLKKNRVKSSDRRTAA